MIEPERYEADLSSVDEAALSLCAAVRVVAKLNPDFKYRPTDDEGSCGCQYAPDDNNPLGCIVGAAARTIGLDLSAHNDSVAGIGYDLCDLYDTFRHLVYEFYGPLIEEQLTWLENVQTEQDNGHSWSAAVRMADEEAA